MKREREAGRQGETHRETSKRYQLCVKLANNDHVLYHTISIIKPNFNFSQCGFVSYPLYCSEVSLCFVFSFSPTGLVFCRKAKKQN